jgi:flagellar hook assembly protein FlgD
MEIKPDCIFFYQNYPNPFNLETLISYKVPKRSQVVLKVMNLLGQEVLTLVNEDKPAGFYKVSWDGKNHHGQMVASGVYLYRLESSDFVQTRKMVFLQ